MKITYFSNIIPTTDSLFRKINIEYIYNKRIRIEIQDPYFGKCYMICLHINYITPQLCGIIQKVSEYVNKDFEKKKKFSKDIEKYNTVFEIFIPCPDHNFFC